MPEEERLCRALPSACATASRRRPERELLYRWLTVEILAGAVSGAEVDKAWTVQFEGVVVRLVAHRQPQPAICLIDGDHLSALVTLDCRRHARQRSVLLSRPGQPSVSDRRQGLEPAPRC